MPSPVVTMAASMAVDITRSKWLLRFAVRFDKESSPDSKIHRANMGPIWGQQDPGGPHVGPMNFAIWVNMNAYAHVKARSLEKENTSVLTNIKHYLRGENKSNKNKVWLYHEIFWYIQILMHKDNQYHWIVRWFCEWRYWQWILWSSVSDTLDINQIKFQHISR